MSPKCRAERAERAAEVGLTTLATWLARCCEWSDVGVGDAAGAASVWGLALTTWLAHRSEHLVGVGPACRTAAGRYWAGVHFSVQHG